MKKTVSFRSIAARFLTLCLLAAVIAAAAAPAVSAKTVPYSTYTYAYSGDYQVSPHAYVPGESIADFGEAGVLSAPKDMTADSRGRVAIADSGNNRVVLLNPDLTLWKVIEAYPNGAEDMKLKNPSGVFFDAENRLYIADTDNGNLVQYSAEAEFERIIPAPSAELLPDDFDYRPTSLAVDKYNRFYVISSGTNMGVITFDTNGVFEGFIGAQKVQGSMLSKFWQHVMTEEQLERMPKNVPMSYNNIAMDNRGFIYVTTSSIDGFRLQQMVSSRSGSSDFSPVKKLNPSGIDVLKRTGFFPPVGDLEFSPYVAKGKKNPSAFTEVVIRDDDVYTVVDSKYNKLFTYDEYGNLLYAFGGNGTVDGVFSSLVSATYQGDRMLALDAVRCSVTVFEKTDYGRLIDKAIRLQRDRKFSETIPVWQEIEKHNNNYDLAYMGIGKSLLEQKEYKEAMEYFRAVSNKEYYSKAMKKYRGEILHKTAILIPVVVVLLLWLLARFFRFAKKYNKAHRPFKEKRTLREQLMYAFHLIVHPFDGFWDLKHEKRGGVKGATVLLALATLAVVVRDFMSGYLYTDLTKLGSLNITSSLLNMLLPFFLWCVANWCLTSLMDGKGSFKDIYVATAYGLTPLVLLVIPATLLSNVLIMEELAFVSYAINFAFIWTGLLIFFGSMVTHDYSLGKNVLVSILTIVGIGIILFLGFLFFNVSSRMITFIQNIITELSFRM